MWLLHYVAFIVVAGGTPYDCWCSLKGLSSRQGTPKLSAFLPTKISLPSLPGNLPYYSLTGRKSAQNYKVRSDLWTPYSIGHVHRSQYAGIPNWLLACRWFELHRVGRYIASSLVKVTNPWLSTRFRSRPSSQNLNKSRFLWAKMTRPANSMLAASITSFWSIFRLFFVAN